MAKKDQKKESDFQVKLNKFEVESFEFNEPKKEPKDFGFNLNIEAKEKEKTAEIRITIDVKQSKKAKDYISKIITNSIFDIKSDTKESDFDLPEDLMYRLIDICFATTRGALAVKSEKTFLADYPLPLLDINGLNNIEEATISNQKRSKKKSKKG